MATVGWLRHHFLPPSETFVYASLRALERHRARVFTIARHLPEKFPFEDVTVLGQRPLGWLEAALYRTTTWSPTFFAWARTLDVLHAHMGWTGVHGLLAARRLGLPLVTSFYGRDVTLLESRARLGPAYWHYWLLGPTLFERGDRFVVLSRHMRRALAARGCPEHKLRIVRLGIDVGRFAPRRGPRTAGAPVTVLMVGREVEKKGFDDGLRACARARALGADLRVVVLGTGGPLRSSLQRLASALRLDVAWPAPASPVPAAMAGADVLLAPSRTARDGDQEGTPTVICEGSAAGLAVVATRHAGIPEQVEDGATGLLVEEGDVEGLAAHLATLARAPQVCFELGRAGRVKIEREYSIGVHARALEAVYDELLGAVPEGRAEG